MSSADAREWCRQKRSRLLEQGLSVSRWHMRWSGWEPALLSSIATPMAVTHPGQCGQGCRYRGDDSVDPGSLEEISRMAPGSSRPFRSTSRACVPVASVVGRLRACRPFEGIATDFRVDPVSVLPPRLRRRRALHRSERLPSDVRPRHDRNGHRGAGNRCGHAQEKRQAVTRNPGRARRHRILKSGGKVEEARLFNVVSYLHAQDVEIDVEGLGTLTVDLSHGGNFYVIVEPQATSPGFDRMSASEIVGLSPKVRAAVQAKLNPAHPDDRRIAGVSHVMWCDKPPMPKRMRGTLSFTGRRLLIGHRAERDRRHEWLNWWRGNASISAKHSSMKASSARCSIAA